MSIPSAPHDPKDAHDGPIQRLLHADELYAGEGVTIDIESPSMWDAFATRVEQRDPTKGCGDPDELRRGLRDVAVVVLDLGEGRTTTLRLPAFTAQLSDPDVLHCWQWLGMSGEDNIEEDEDERTKDLRRKLQAQDEAFRRVYSEGIWTGTLVWDSSVHMVEYLLSTKELHQKIQGANVLELGCGLGLPGFACSAMGAERVALTDRSMVVDMCQVAIQQNARTNMLAHAFDWNAQDARKLQAEVFDGRIDVILACDCIFELLFDGFLLLDMLLVLADENTTILLGVERRIEDGVDRFFAKAAQFFSITVVWAFEGDSDKVALYQLRKLKPMTLGLPATAAAGGDSETTASQSSTDDVVKSRDWTETAVWTAAGLTVAAAAYAAYMSNRVAQPKHKPS